MTVTARDDWIDRARTEKTETVLRERGILKTLKGRNGTLAGPCPKCGGQDRFGVSLKKGSGGVFHCRGCGACGGDAISLVRFLDCCDFQSAVETLVGPLSDKNTETDEERRAREQRLERLEYEQREREAREAAEVCKTIRYCDRLWEQSVNLPAQALAYFERRGIVIDDMPNQGGLRFVERCPFDGMTLPCIVARYTHAATNVPGGLWRRPLAGEKPKSIGPIKGHVIRLSPDVDVETGLVIAEGVETALAATTRVTHRGTLLRPIWACGCADNVRRFPVLSGIEHLTILSDNDESGVGQSAARDCARRWAVAGRKFEMLIPNATGEDFNDIVLRNAS